MGRSALPSEREQQLPVPLLSARVEQMINDSAYGGSKPSTARTHALNLQRALLRHCLPDWCNCSAHSFDPHAAAMASNVPASARRLVDSSSAPIAALSSEVVHEQLNERNDTRKLLIRLADGFTIESVVMEHAYRRVTVCVSSQVGCKMGCRFCATSKLGELANLTGGEIVEQVLHASMHSGLNVTNVVFMGQGEPLNNARAVRESVRLLINHKLFSLSPKRVTISTVGVAPGVEAMADDDDLMRVSLALSLHAPTQELRQKIVPSAGKNRLERLIPACERLLDRKGAGARLMIEYCAIHGINDSDDCARMLGSILPAYNVVFNVIPLNPSESLDPSLKPPTEERLQSIVRILANEKGRFCTIRHEMGQDADAACGQLSLKVSPEQQGQGESIVDMEDTFNKQFEHLPRKARPTVKRWKGHDELKAEESKQGGKVTCYKEERKDKNDLLKSSPSVDAMLERISHVGIGVAFVGLLASLCMSHFTL